MDLQDMHTKDQNNKTAMSARSSSTYTIIWTIQITAWPMYKDDTQIPEAQLGKCTVKQILNAPC